MIPLPAATAWNTPTLANLVWRTQAPQLHFLKTHKAGFIHKSWFWALLNYFCSFSDVLSGIPGVWAENCKLCLAAAAAHTKNTSGLMYSVTCSLTTFNQCFRDLHFNVFLYLAIRVVSLKPHPLYLTLGHFLRQSILAQSGFLQLSPMLEMLVS